MKNIILFFLLFKNIPCNNWSGISARLQGGIALDYLDIPSRKGKAGIKNLSCNTLFGWGLEYSFLTSKNLYFSLDLGFPYYDLILKNDQVTANPIFSDKVFKSLWLLTIPIPYLHLGYLIKEDLVLTLGPAYFWGIFCSLKKSISDNYICEFKHVWFIDRFIYGDGIHDMHLLFSLAYKF